jgi:hypothetical protein
MVLADNVAYQVSFVVNIVLSDDDLAVGPIASSCHCTLSHRQRFQFF